MIIIIIIIVSQPPPFKDEDGMQEIDSQLLILIQLNSKLNWSFCVAVCVCSGDYCLSGHDKESNQLKCQY